MVAAVKLRRTWSLHLQEAKQKAEAAEKAREEEQKQKAAEASKKDAEEADRLRIIEEAQAKDRAILEVLHVL